MANKPLQSITFPDLPDTYTIPQVTTDLTQANKAAEAKKVGDELDELKSAIDLGSITPEVKTALLDCFAHVAWIDEHGQDYYDALEAALYPPAELVSISADYTQSGTVYDTDSLDDLKADLVVTATYDDSSTATVTGYTLSGTLTEGTSTITVSYGGQTDTFTVTVTHESQVVKVKFNTLTPVTGKLMKTDGSTASVSSGAYVELPYIDGMYIYTLMSSSWSTYQKVVLYNGSSYQAVSMTGGDTIGTSKEFTATLSGYSGITKVFVNSLSSQLASGYYEAEV